MKGAGLSPPGDFEKPFCGLRRVCKPYMGRMGRLNVVPAKPTREWLSVFLTGRTCCPLRGGPSQSRYSHRFL